jgi:hypothetical protein
MSSSVHRLWIGSTGLLIRPAIDYYNGDVDKETRKYSAAKTAVKVAITVFNGVLTRIAAERLGITLVKKGIIQPLRSGLDTKEFAKGVATVTSFLATVFTTFTLDIPLINSGLNFTLDKLFPGQRK